MLNSSTQNSLQTQKRKIVIHNLVINPIKCDSKAIDTTFKSIQLKYGHYVQRHYEILYICYIFQNPVTK